MGNLKLNEQKTNKINEKKLLNYLYHLTFKILVNKYWSMILEIYLCIYNIIYLANIAIIFVQNQNWKTY